MIVIPILKPVYKGKITVREHVDSSRAVNKVNKIRNNTYTFYNTIKIV